MSRGPHAFKQRDVTRAIKGARAAGMPVGKVLIDRSGNIQIIPQGEPEAVVQPSGAEGDNEWDAIK